MAKSKIFTTAIISILLPNILSGKPNMEADSRHFRPFNIKVQLLKEERTACNKVKNRLGDKKPRPSSNDSIPSLTMKELRELKSSDRFNIILITDKGKDGLFKHNKISKEKDDSSMVIISNERRYERVYDGYLKPEWFGAIANDTIEDTEAFIKLRDKVSGVMHIPAGTYIINNLELHTTGIIGEDNGTTILKASKKKPVLILGWDNPHWRKKTLERLTIDGNSKNANGIEFNSKISPETSGRWVIEKITFQNCNRAISKPTGNIGNVYRDCYFQSNSFGYYALGAKNPFMHAGFDSFYNCSFIDNSNACLFIDSKTPGTGGTTLENCHFEDNPGFGLFVQNYETGWSPLTVNGLWTENNATTKQVKINGLTYKPSAIYLANTDNFSFSNSALADGIVIKNSSGSFRSSYIYGSGEHTVDSLSVVYGEELVTDIYKGPIIVNSLRDTKRPLSNFSDVLRAPSRNILTRSANKLLSETFSDSAVTLGGKKVRLKGVPRRGGISFDSYNRFDIPKDNIQISKTITVKRGKFYVFSIAIRQVSEEKPLTSFSYGISASNNLQEQFIKDKWITLATVGEADTTGTVCLYISTTGKKGNCVLDLQALQIVEFNLKEEAISFYNQKYFAL